jgi:hypothetical protein
VFRGTSFRTSKLSVGSATIAVQVFRGTLRPFFTRARVRETDRLATPEIISIRPGRSGRLGATTSAAIAVLDQLVEIRSPDPDPPTHPQGWQRSLIDPVPNRLLIQLQRLRDLGNGQEGIFTISGFHASPLLIETN